MEDPESSEDERGRPRWKPENDNDCQEYLREIEKQRRAFIAQRNEILKKNE